MPIDERLVFYEGIHVRLKVLDANDIEESGWVGWFNNENLCRTNQHHYFPNSFESQKFFLESLAANKEKFQLGIISRGAPDVICGVVSLNKIDLINRNAEISGFQDTNLTRLNPNIFYESWKIVLRHGFEQLGLKRIYSGAFRPFSAEALTRAFNFETEGVLKRHVFKDGSFKDVTLSAVFDDTIKYPDL